MARRSVNLFAVLALIVVSLPGTRSALNKDKVVVAINCGSQNTFTTSSGVVYSADRYFHGGIESGVGEHYDEYWPELDDIELYQTERYSSSDLMQYELPLRKGAEDGHYVLVLKFSEVYFSAPNSKVFDIALGSQTVVSNLDIFAEAGKFTPHDEYIEFDVKAKTVYFKNKAVNDGLNKDKSTVVVKFLKGKVDNPKVNALVLVKGGLKGMLYHI